MRRLVVPVVASMLTVSGLSAALPAGAVTVAGGTSCSVVWGSGAKVDSDMSGAHLVDVRAGRHACFDRLVLDLDGSPGGFAVRYVPQVTGLASGAPVALRGGSVPRAHRPRAGP